MAQQVSNRVGADTVAQLVSADGCTGCTACYSVCPAHAIHMSENDYGEMVPTIDASACTECGLCLRICPQNSLYLLQKPSRCYAVWAKDENDANGSASGGIGYLLARAIIERGGAVCGCVMQAGVNPCHIIVENIEGLEGFRSSKYVQSSVGESFTEIKNLLKKGREVLFIGTPCQVAGLRSFMGEADDKLFVVDLICHGVPPVRYLREHLACHANLADIEMVRFRERELFKLTAVSADGAKIYSNLVSEDEYLSTFILCDSYRQSCYSCHYSRQERVGDLTIGDFWGLDRSTLQNKPPRAVSVVLENTVKGSALIEAIADVAIMEQRTIEEAIVENKQLRQPPQGTKLRGAFRDSVSRMSFHEACKASGISQCLPLSGLKPPSAQ